MTATSAPGVLAANVAGLLRDLAPSVGANLVLAHGPLGSLGAEQVLVDPSAHLPAALLAVLRTALSGRALGSITLVDLPAGASGSALLATLRALAEERAVPLVVAARNQASLEGLSALLGEPPAGGTTEERLRAAARAAGWREVAAADVPLPERAPPGSVLHGAGALLHRYLAGLRGAAKPASTVGCFVRAFLPAPGRTVGSEPESLRPFLSVVMRTQGQRPASLRDALLAMLAQTSTDLEVLVVAHKVPAAQKTVIDEIVAGLPDSLRARTRLVLVEDGGRSRPLNAGFAAARGAYITILDDDDMVFAHWVETFEAAARIGPGTVLRAVAVEQEIEERQWPRGGVTAYRNVGKLKKSYPSTFDLFAHFTQNFTPPMVYAFPRGAFHELGLRFDETLNTLEDWDFELRAIMACGVTAVPEITAVYRRWRTGTSSYTLHSQQEWKENEARVVAKLDQQPHLFPPGTVEQIRKEQARTRKLEGDVAWLEGQLHAARGGAPLPAPLVAPAPAGPAPRPLRYEVADRVNAALKKLPLIHPLIRKSMTRRGQ